MPSVVFISNFFNHHQAPFAQAMDTLTEHNFYFIETKPISEERKNMGWGKESKPDYVIRTYEGKRAQAKMLIDNADVVIWGSCPFRYVKLRLKNKKLTFAYSERIFKKNSRLQIFLRTIKYFFKLHAYQENHYLLCASAYAAEDYNSIGLFRNKSYKWGYFPKFYVYDDINTILQKKQNNTLLWCARFLDLKHPEIAVDIARRLKEDGYLFKLNMIGSGVCFSSCEALVHKYGLESCVHFLGTMSPQEVRAYMQTAGIFLFTSDENEGWGAVLNEAMNSACAIVANKKIGSVPFLLKDEENGEIYTEDTSEVYEVVKILLENPERAATCGINAYQTIVTEWNAETAAKRLLDFVQSFYEGNTYVVESGPLSRA